MGDALERRALVLRRDCTGLVHCTVPLVLEDQPVGALLAGQVFDQYPEQLVLEHMATRWGVPPGALGQAFLETRYHTLLDAQRFAALEQRFQARTTALHQESAARQLLEREAQRTEHFTLLGRLAAGVLHELRNPLGAVVLNVDLLEEELREVALAAAAGLGESLAEIRTHLGRVEDLVDDYLSLVWVGRPGAHPAGPE